jgi:hypothetical protein
MSLQPTFASAIFGVYVAAGGVVGAMGVVALLDHRDARRGATPASARRAFGALWVGLLLIWFYAGYSQYLLAWLANLPAEAAWYLPRTRGSWGAVGLAVAFVQFVVPAALLLLPEIRQRTRVLAGLGVLALLARWLDAAWLVIPAVAPAGLVPHPGDFGAVALLAGVALMVDARRPRAEPTTPDMPARSRAMAGAA